MRKLPGKFVWFEHVSPDTAKARAFYEALCRWSSQPMPMGEQRYNIITNAGQGIGGYRNADKGAHAHWASYLSVPDVDKALKAALIVGAKVVTAPMDFGPAGRGAVITDPTGARVSLWTGARDDPPDVEKTPIGGWHWNELHSKDAKAAVAFYTKAFGLTQDSMDMGPAGTYYLLKDGAGQMRAGIMQQEAGVAAPSNWLPYIQVADCNASTQLAMKLGAKQTIVPPMDVDNIGCFSILIDPFGAPIGLIKAVD